MFEGRPFRVVIEHDFQFVRAARVIQQSGGKVLTLFPQFLFSIKSGILINRLSIIMTFILMKFKVYSATMFALKTWYFIKCTLELIFI